MTRPGIEPRSPGPLANTPIIRHNILYFQNKHIYNKKHEQQEQVKISKNVSSLIIIYKFQH